MENYEENLEAVKKYIEDNELRAKMSSWEHYDVEVDVYFFRTEDGGRHTPATLGYRLGHYVKDDVMTTGVHYYVDQDYLFPGHQAKTYIKFLSPPYYPNCLWVGKKLKINEGATTVGYAQITKIFNNILEKNS